MSTEISTDCIGSYGSNDYFDVINLLSGINPHKAMEVVEGRRFVTELIRSGVAVPKNEDQSYDYDDEQEMFLDQLRKDEEDKENADEGGEIKDSKLELLETHLVNGDSRKKSKKRRCKGANKTSRKAFASVQERLEHTKKVEKHMTRAEVRAMMNEENKMKLKTSFRRSDRKRKEAFSHSFINFVPKDEQGKTDEPEKNMVRFNHHLKEERIKRAQVHDRRFFEDMTMYDEAQARPYLEQIEDEKRTLEYHNIIMKAKYREVLARALEGPFQYPDILDPEGIEVECVNREGRKYQKAVAGRQEKTRNRKGIKKSDVDKEYAEEAA